MGWGQLSHKQKWQPCVWKPVLMDSECYPIPPPDLEFLWSGLTGTVSGLSLFNTIPARPCLEHCMSYCPFAHVSGTDVPGNAETFEKRIKANLRPRISKPQYLACWIRA